MASTAPLPHPQNDSQRPLIKNNHKTRWISGWILIIRQTSVSSLLSHYLFQCIYRYISSRLYISYIFIPFLLFLLIWRFYFSAHFPRLLNRHSCNSCNFPPGINQVFLILILIKVDFYLPLWHLYFDYILSTVMEVWMHHAESCTESYQEIRLYLIYRDQSRTPLTDRGFPIGGVLQFLLWPVGGSKAPPSVNTTTKAGRSSASLTDR